MSNSVAYSDENRSWTTAVLVGYHTEGTGRLRLGYLGGVAFVGERTHAVSVSSSPGIPPLIPARTERYERTDVGYRPAVAVGFDIEIGIASHVAAVPRLRVVAFTGRLSVRPGRRCL